MDEVYLTEAPRINRYLNLLPAFANISMLCGLLGTIFGLILAFDAVANLPAAQRPQASANGISIVMVNTWTGLAIAIPILAPPWLARHAVRAPPGRDGRKGCKGDEPPLK